MSAIKTARRLGLLSVGLGVTQLVAPRWLGRMIGIENRPQLIRAMGARELATGAGALVQENPSTSLWARVAGDVLDATLLATALPSGNVNRGRVAGALGMVLGVGVLDVLNARRLRSSWR